MKYGLPYKGSNNRLPEGGMAGCDNIAAYGTTKH